MHSTVDNHCYEMLLYSGWAAYFTYMENRYHTLQTLAAIVGGSSNPVQYQCTMREMILHSVFDWKLIMDHLTALSQEELVVLTVEESPRFSITRAGLEMVDALLPQADNALKLVYSEILSA